jgi:hypothetical protein
MDLIILQAHSADAARRAVGIAAGVKGAYYRAFSSTLQPIEPFTHGDAALQDCRKQRKAAVPTRQPTAQASCSNTCASRVAAPPHRLRRRSHSPSPPKRALVLASNSTRLPQAAVLHRRSKSRNGRRRCSTLRQRDSAST